MEKKRRLIWDRPALIRFRKSLDWISDNSIQQADLVEAVILEKLKMALDNPEYFPPDKYKKVNDGSYRAFEAHSYRVSYRFRDFEIRIVRLRHVKQNPTEY